MPPGHGVLSKSEIVRLSDQQEIPLVDPLVSNHELIPPAAYDLRLGHVITAKEHLRWDGPTAATTVHVLSPGEIATLASHEQLNLRYDINGVVVPKNGSAKKGLLTLNAGHIDPGYRGVVTAQVINLTDRPFPLVLGRPYFSAIFSWVPAALEADKYKKSPADTETYLADLRINAVESPLSLIRPEALRRTYLPRADLAFAMLRIMIPFVIALAGLIAVIFGILQATGVL